jgi:probable H4MPT-linked C1 transfer pathway protein
MQVLGLDIGGANIKAATDTAEAYSVPLEIWRSPDRLVDTLVPIMDRFSAAEMLAVTTTAELADCFATKADGIDRVLRTVEVVAGKRPIRVWQTSGEFVSTQAAREESRLTAAANWHALATFVGRLTPRGSAMLIDIGSTTTDLIPLLDGLPNPTGRTDVERLQSGELVYCGVRRTPLCALTDCVPLGETNCAVAAELFATIYDVYLTLGDIPENSADCLTANGRPATLAGAHDRIARAIGGDVSEISPAETHRIAEYLAEKQLRRLCDTAETIASRMPGPCDNVLVSGSGSFLARRVAAHTPRLQNAAITALPELFGPRVSDAACAFAVAKLAAERELRFFGASR